MRVLIWFIFFFLALQLGGQSVITVVLQPEPIVGKDAVVWTNNANGNLGEVESNTVYTWTNNGLLGNKRAFLEFDLSVIPENATIVSAGLSLYYNPTDPYEGFDQHTGANDLLIQRVLSVWEESTITWNNQPPATDKDQVSLPPSTTGVQDYLDVDVTALVSDMTDPDLEGNYGFMLRLADEQNFYKSLIFASSDHPNNMLRPKLEITYMPGSITCETFRLSLNEETQEQHALLGSGNYKQDAVVWSNDPNSNLGGVESNTIYTWTNNGLLGNKRAFLEFDLSAIPENPIIVSAGLSLSYNPTDPYEGFDQHTGANDLLIQRVLSEWEEGTITWNNQPPTTDKDQVSLPPSTTGVQDYLDIDVTALVSDMTSPDLEGNHGFMLRLTDEQNFYKSLIFASGDHANSALHPLLKVCWTEAAITSIPYRKIPDLDFEIYPNPGFGTFQFRFPGGVPNQYSIEITDLSGRKISAYKGNDQRINIYEKGIFLVRVTDLQGRYATRKLIVR